VNLLLDTHALLWWLGGTPLEVAATDAIASPRNRVHVSAASAWEISIKRALGKLRAPDELVEACQVAGFEPLSIRFEHAERAGALPPHHRDPFDRMLVAQAQVDDLVIVSRDRSLVPYDVELLAC